MKQLMLIILFAVSITLAGCDGKTANSTVNKPTPSASPANTTPTLPANGDYPGKGKITKINMEMASIELDHEEIKGVMPAMKMEFFVSEKKILSGLAVGDKIDFTLRYKDNTEIIVDIKKTQ
jgi:Cu/Ag efflux protein CusF